MEENQPSKPTKKTSKAWLWIGLVNAAILMAVDFFVIPLVNNDNEMTTGYVFVAIPFWVVSGILLGLINKLVRGKK